MRGASLLIGILIFAFPFTLQAEDKVELKNVSFQTIEKEHTRVIVELSGKIGFTKGRLSNPERLYIDLQDCTVAKTISKTLRVDDRLLDSVRVGQFNQDVSRVVIEFDGKDSVSRLEISEESSPDRLIIDVFGKNYRQAGTLTIVIDAGHGGHDPGAVGRAMLKEKDVTLSIALMLKRLLEEDTRYKVILTRDKDVFLELNQRTEIANKENADLFISIHANANPNRKAKGIETYLLNWTDDEEAIKVAARENSISIRKMKKARTEVGLILASLELQSKRDESLKLAHFVQNSLVTGLGKRYLEVEDLGVKQALFYVLVGAKMPSVLVEVSFISNPKEERLLKKNSYREDLANGIVMGIEKYISSLVPVQEFAKNQ
ncbi:MAG: N-acetylmuramoyl-L-alanine amidase [Nitrospirae bacterium]|nr:N-acetylmuramoyl-L-alanine amidase [Nitrospirota bacterium]